MKMVAGWHFLPLAVISVDPCWLESRFIIIGTPCGWQQEDRWLSSKLCIHLTGDITSKRKQNHLKWPPWIFLGIRE
uniref:Putative secreted peptide n=1 Tax=Anopheles braziliensis TaxID=58242 RepID=A0A2M3ZWU8_9DIPT